MTYNVYLIDCAFTVRHVEFICPIGLLPFSPFPMVFTLYFTVSPLYLGTNSIYHILYSKYLVKFGLLHVLLQNICKYQNPNNKTARNTSMLNLGRIE